MSNELETRTKAVATALDALADDIYRGREARTLAHENLTQAFKALLEVDPELRSVFDRDLEDALTRTKKELRTLADDYRSLANSPPEGAQGEPNCHPRDVRTGMVVERLAELPALFFDGSHHFMKVSRGRVVVWDGEVSKPIQSEDEEVVHVPTVDPNNKR